MFLSLIPLRCTSWWLRSLAAALAYGWALVLLGAGLGHAQPVLDGFLQATSACAATPAIRSPNNPGDVRLKPGTTYRILAENRAGGTHYLLITPGASPEKRWVEKTCGTLASSADNPAVAEPGGVAPAPAARGGAPARTDRRMSGSRMIVAMNWQPAFCETSGSPECTSQTANRFDASNFALHGLWPQPRGREFCGVSSRLREADEGDWTALPAPELSAATKRALDEAMPGTRSGLDRHEWLRHGTCYGTDAEEYFQDSLEVLKAVNASDVRRLFADRVGRNVTRDEVRAAFDRSFGAGAGDRVRLTCRRDGGRELVSEITLGLSGDIRPDADLSPLILAAPEARGGCSGGLVDAVGRQ